MSPPRIRRAGGGIRLSDVQVHPVVLVSLVVHLVSADELATTLTFLWPSFCSCCKLVTTNHSVYMCVSACVYISDINSARFPPVIT